MDTVTLYEEAPPSYGEDFLPYLKQNNVVVSETRYWVVIENTKYHKPNFPHYTVFCKRYAESWGDFSTEELTELKQMLQDYADWMKYENAAEYKTIHRFHMHIVRNYDNWLEMMYFAIKNEVGKIIIKKDKLDT